MHFLHTFQVLPAFAIDLQRHPSSAHDSIPVSALARACDPTRTCFVIGFRTLAGFSRKKVHKKKEEDERCRAKFKTRQISGRDANETADLQFFFSKMVGVGA